MSRTLRVAVFTLLLVSLAAIVAADSHEEPNIYVWINFVEAQPGQGDALVGLLMKDAAVLDPLVDSGAALEWGIAMPAVHAGGDVGVRAQWVTFVGWAGVDSFMGAFMANMQSMSEDDQKAMADEWQSVVVGGSHRDQIDRSVHVGSQSAGSPSYIHLSYWKTKPGSNARQIYVDNLAPIFQQVMDAGGIQNYGLHTPAVHQGEDWNYMSWYMSSDLAARDAVRNAFDAAEAARSEDENKAWWEAVGGTFEARPVDQIMMVVHHKTASAGGEGD